MNTSERGLKHICPECASKYFDLNNKIVACPGCGAKPLAAKKPRKARSFREPSKKVFRQYP